MKLTKKLEAELRQLYDAFMESMLSANQRKFKSLLADDFKQIGTTLEEVWFSKNEAAKYLKTSLKPVAGNIELRNRHIRLDAIDNLVLIIEQADCYVKTDAVWIFYDKCRISSFLKKKETGWKIIQQHLSFPDNRTEDGETIALEKISKENIELRDAVKRRTIELEEKNRELEIETALERVRSRTMAMHKSEELKDTTLVLFQQFKSLGINTSQVSICIFDEQVKMGEMFMTLKGEKLDNSVQMELDKEVFVMRKAKKAFLNKQKKYSQTIKGKELQVYNRWRNSLIGKKKWNESAAVTKQEWHVNIVFFSRGILGISSETPPSSEALQLLERFAKVFDLTFTRFLDLQKAEAQAREAQIEAALERVRAKAMAMHNSKDISTTAGIVLSELKKLDINPRRFAVGLLEKGSRKVQSYSFFSSPSGDSLALTGWIILSGHPVLEKFYECLQKGKDYFPELHGNQYKSYYKSIASGLSLKPVSQSELKQKHFGHFFSISVGYLVAWSENAYQESEIKIIKRFASIIDLTFRRFLDLQKAEAQAREAQIQLSLERIRARTMAMHKSDELGEVVVLLYKELRALGLIRFFNCGYVEVLEDKNLQHFWVTNPEGKGLQQDTLPLRGDPVMNTRFKAWKKRETLFHQKISGKALQKHIDFVSPYFDSPEIQKMVRAQFPQTAIFYCGNFSHGYLHIVSETELTPEEETLFIRFTQVFKLSYGRFHDLKKAEAQAREAEIELALERVRARTMAMHHSNELNEAAELLYGELLKLNVERFSCGYTIINELDNIGYNYMANPQGQIFSKPIRFNVKGHTVLKKMFHSWKKQEPFLSIELNEKDNIDHHRYLAENAIDFPFTAKKFLSILPRETVLNTFNFKYGYLIVVHQNKFVTEEVQLMIRFTKVFEQTFTRFLDLQKAEAQAREAEIELALERVRARTMAMQKSDELKEAATVLYKELKSLNIGDMFNCGYVFVDENNNLQHAWMTHTDGSIRDSHAMPLTGDKVLDERYDKWKKGVKLVSQKVGGEKLKKHNAFTTRQSNRAPENNKGLSQLPDPVIFYCGNFSDGYLHILSREELSKESELILSRFTKVFEQTYTRFLDLQKAEAQAREGQIQLALERVRARTMAMQKSEELSDAAAVLFQQFNGLGQELMIMTIGIIQEDKGVTEFSVTDWGGSGAGVNRSFNLSNDEPTLISKLYEGWKQQKKSIVVDLAGKELEDWLTYRNAMSGVTIHSADSGGRRVIASAFFSKGHLSFSSPTLPPAENIQLLERFANVFDQTYTRFLDLQKAEAQAREAQIEASLERVRARTMAMQKSDELAEAAQLLYAEFRTLGINTFLCGYLFYKEEQNKQTSWTTLPDGTLIPDFVEFPLTGDPVLNKRYEDWKQKKPLHVLELKGEENKKHHQFLASVVADQSAKEIFSKIPDRIIFYCANFSAGYLFIIATEFYSTEEEEVIIRFAKVFDLTYTRFLDLQKAEAQARESQIQLALERVRARTMAMHKSDELPATVKIMFEEFRNLQHDEELKNVSRAFLTTINEENKMFDLWVTDIGGNEIKQQFKIDFDEPIAGKAVYKAWKNKQPFYVSDLQGEKLTQWLDYLRSVDFNVDPSLYGTRRVNNYIYYSKGFIGITSSSNISEDNLQILMRFAKVFDQTYTRFLDLQKAEAQARESQIQLALERVRARTMAMHNSQEVGKAVITLFDELVKICPDELDRCGIGIMHDNYIMDAWTASKTDENREVLVIGSVDMKPHPLLRGAYEAWINKMESFQYILEDDDKINYFNIINAQHHYKAYRDISTLSHKIVITYFYFREGGIYVFSEKELFSETGKIISRFAGVFGQTYRRFLDLQKAEAQAKEAQIEAALERVRSKAMAMHNSDDLPSTAIIAFTELKKLGFIPMRCGISLQNKENRKNLLYAAISNEDGDNLSLVGWAILDDHPILAEIYNSWMRGEDYFPTMKDEVLRSYYEKVKHSFKIPLEYSPEQEQFGYFMYFTHGVFYGWCDKPIAEEDKRILRRFASVVDLTFKRYFDLQKAEAQAREAQIEASLERVRAKAMAMHSSADLALTVSLFFSELNALHVTPHRCGVSMMNEATRDAAFVATTATEEGLTKEMSGVLKLTGHPVLDAVFESWKKQKEYHPVLKGIEIKKYYEVMNPQVEFPDFSNDAMQYGHYFSFKEGFVFAWTEKDLSEEDLQIFRKFTSVLSLTHRRYIDLKKAEASAREAVKQAALDRIRADIASMRTIGDLNRIIPLIWNELTILGLPFIRCGVFIMDNEHQLIHTFLSTPEGKAIAAFHIPYDTPGKIRLIPENWKKKTGYVEHWNDSDFIDFANTLVKQRVIDSSEQYLASIPHGGFHLHFVPFLQGMLYVGNTNPLGKSEVSLVESVADAFSTAYARYEDFKKLEAAKQQVDKTLTDLRQAQQQLVQSEKMASLGEMTAGIAHEIQNPLNFVNNFSDVSTELLEEMKQELATGNLQQATEIADDVIQNLGKILLHGKRADGIVKSMLQHSRVGSGKKEPTDINALADEYLRLSFHGLRAKDKSFNAKFETDLDQSIGKINIVAQDIGRVILNLINNAFYAVTEKKKQMADAHLPDGQGYEPTVIVSTKNLGDKIEVKVKDNGSGIPQKVLDKIFQPFFTTKPTGQGTGLGLSLAYDLITKGHGGELKAETKQGESSEFIVILPL